MPKDRKRKSSEVDEVEIKKHYETFYEQAPPGTVQEEVERPEDCIPDMPGNEDARNFLAHAPSKGLWMPLGKEVKVMKCWRCKQYGHRTGDKECPMFTSGNRSIEKFRTANEDPMHDFIAESKRNEKQSRIDQLKMLLAESTTSEDSSSSSDESEESSPKRRKNTKDKLGKRKKKQRHKREETSSEESDNNRRKHRHSTKRKTSESEDSDSDKEHKKVKKHKHEKKHRHHSKRKTSDSDDSSSDTGHSKVKRHKQDEKHRKISQEDKKAHSKHKDRKKRDKR